MVVVAEREGSSLLLNKWSDNGGVERQKKNEYQKRGRGGTL